jgi:hypothetical protein
MKKSIAIFASVALAGCATASKDIASTYTSPITYSSYDCQQIISEHARIQSKITQLGGRLDEAASNDKAIMAAGAILFWPALFALGGTKAQEAEYATMKGQYDAVQQAAIEKKCNMQSTPPSVPVTAPVPTAAPEKKI